MNEESLNKKTSKKKLIIVLICVSVVWVSLFAVPLLIFFLSLTKEYAGYTGKYPELFTVGAYGIPNMNGCIYYEVTDEPVVHYLEEDEYGRVLFCYSEEYGKYSDGRNQGKADHGGVNLVICQGHDTEYAYYYKDCHYISAPLCVGNNISVYGDVKPPAIKNPYNDFSEEQIAKLKEENDWGRELNLDKCEKSKIVRKK